MQTNKIDAAKQEIDAKIRKAYEKAVAAGTLPPGGEDVVGTIDIPRDVAHGDFASAWAMAAAREFKMQPKKIRQLTIIME